MPAKPMLDRVLLQQVQEIESQENESFNQHQVAALEGDFLQDLGRRSSRISLNGILTGPDAEKSVETLRSKFRAAAPVPFVADIGTATKISQVLIEELGVRELAGKPQRFEYAVTLAEFIDTSKPASASPAVPRPAVPRPAPPKVHSGTLLVEVIGRNQAAVDLNRATVIVNGAKQSGQRLSKTLSNRSGNVWSEDGFPPGKYTAKVAVTAPHMSGAAAVSVRPAQTTRVTVTLHPGATIARAFAVHFSPGRCFIEPAMRDVLAQAARYAQANPAARLLVTGHADAGGDAGYEQLISEQRARAVYATLAFGRSPEPLMAQWSALREIASSDRKIAWNTREYQLILQDLGYFRGHIDGNPQVTNTAVRDFQLDHGLPADGIVDDATWAGLIHAYLEQMPAAVPESRFLPETWLGLGNRCPVSNTRDAWRPNRRAEVLFVTPGIRPANPAGWVTIPAESGSITVRGSVRSGAGNPVAGLEYVLIAADGECMDGERWGGPDAGSPIPGRTAADGTFAYPEIPKGVGTYTLEVRGPFVARLPGEPPSAAKGPSVTKRLDGSSGFDVIVSRQ